MRTLLLAALGFVAGAAAPFPCVFADGRVMFRVAAPDAQKVRVRLGPGVELTTNATR